MFDLIHTYIHVLLKNNNFVDNYIGVVISASPFNGGNDLKGVARWVRKIILV